MSDESTIRSRERMAQIRDFSGLHFGSIIPTDIDGLIEYQNLCFILIETKFGDAQLPFGQELALERLTDAIQASGKPAICIVASHTSSGDIDVGATKVTKYRSRFIWRVPLKPITTRAIIEGFIKHIKSGKF